MRLGTAIGWLAMRSLGVRSTPLLGPPEELTLTGRRSGSTRGIACISGAGRASGRDCCTALASTLSLKTLLAFRGAALPEKWAKAIIRENTTGTLIVSRSPFV